MHLVRATMQEEVQERRVGGLVGRLARLGDWWRERTLLQQKREAKRQMFLVESIQLGPKQRVVLLRCGEERFLVGTGTEGIQSIVRVAGVPSTGELPMIAKGVEGAGARWG